MVPLCGSGDRNIFCLCIEGFGRVLKHLLHTIEPSLSRNDDSDTSRYKASLFHTEGTVTTLISSSLIMTSCYRTHHVPRHFGQVHAPLSNWSDKDCPYRFERHRKQIFIEQGVSVALISMAVQEALASSVFCRHWWHDVPLIGS